MSFATSGSEVEKEQQQVKMQANYYPGIKRAAHSYPANLDQMDQIVMSRNELTNFLPSQSTWLEPGQTAAFKK
jgi:hypothetical protein